MSIAYFNRTIGIVTIRWTNWRRWHCVICIRAIAVAYGGTTGGGSLAIPIIDTVVATVIIVAEHFHIFFSSGIRQGCRIAGRAEKTQHGLWGWCWCRFQIVNCCAGCSCCSGGRSSCGCLDGFLLFLLQEEINLEPIRTSAITWSTLRHADQQTFTQATCFARRTILLIDCALATILAFGYRLHVVVGTSEERLKRNENEKLEHEIRSG